MEMQRRNHRINGFYQAQGTSKTAKEALDEVYVSAGDVAMACLASELPRGPNDIYNARRSARQENAVNIEPSNRSRNAEECAPTNNVKLDGVWTLLERAKREDEAKDSVFIRECSIHPALFVVLVNNQQIFGQITTYFKFMDFKKKFMLRFEPNWKALYRSCTAGQCIDILLWEHCLRCI